MLRKLMVVPTLFLTLPFFMAGAVFRVITISWRAGDLAGNCFIDWTTEEEIDERI